jgi:hypothetical protein
VDLGAGVGATGAVGAGAGVTVTTGVDTVLTFLLFAIATPGRARAIRSVAVSVFIIVSFLNIKCSQVNK